MELSLGQAGNYDIELVGILTYMLDKVNWMRIILVLMTEIKFGSNIFSLH